MLGHGNGMGPAALTNQGSGASDKGLRLRVPGSIPTHSVGQGETRGDLPLVLPIETEADLVVGFKSVGLDDILAVQAKSLEVERGRTRLDGGSRWASNGGVEVANSIENVFTGGPASEYVLTVDEGAHVPPKLYLW